MMQQALKCSMGVVVMLKSKMTASSARSGEIEKRTGSESSNKSPEPLLDGPATSEHMSALLPFKFPTLGKYVILDLFMTTTSTIHIRAAKALFGAIMHKVYSLQVGFLSTRHFTLKLTFFKIQVDK